MAVKRNSSAGRMLLVFDTIARLQPIGVSAIARDLDADKSAVQRDLMTLADAGWIRTAPGAKGQWELSFHILAVARPPHSSNNLRQRLRPVLEHLRGSTGETAYLTVPHADRFIVLDAVESPEMLRVVPPLGMIVPIEGSATARAILPFLPAAVQESLLGGPPSEAMRREFAATLDKGFAVNDGDIVPGSVAFASAVCTGGRPCGAIVVTGPRERLQRDRWPEIGRQLRASAQLASQLWPAEAAEDPA